MIHIQHQVPVLCTASGFGVHLQARSVQLDRANVRTRDSRTISLDTTREIVRILTRPRAAPFRCCGRLEATVPTCRRVFLGPFTPAGCDTIGLLFSPGRLAVRDVP